MEEPSTSKQHRGGRSRSTRAKESTLIDQPSSTPTPLRQADKRVPVYNLRIPTDKNRKEDLHLQVKLLHPDAKLPARGSKGAIGYDLFAISSHTIPPHMRLKVPIGISIQLPEGTYGRIAPRSSLAAKHSIDIGAGVIDPDYRGETIVLLVNNGDVAFDFVKGDRIAQLVVECAITPSIKEVAQLNDTTRGSGAFGSTGFHSMEEQQYPQSHLQVFWFLRDALEETM
jgi:dUTP pyrophosphatase